ncbi:MAG: hypothetical protein ISS19_15345 [Bacteroidales bacterium]|nr:hypothetical protein [Bacteroidales bacterium]
MRIIIFTLLLAVTACGSGGPVIYFVSNEGSDAAKGTLGSPFKTIQQAALVMKPRDTCYIREGRYHEQVLLNGRTGSENLPLVFMAYPGEEVTFDGTVPIRSDWTRQEDNLFTAKTDEPVWQLFVEGRSMCSARWPNGNWDDGSVWDKTRSMMWPEEGKGRFGHHFNKELKNLDFSLEEGGIIIVNSGSFKTYKGFITDHEAGSDHFIYDTSQVKQHFSYKGKVDRHGYFLEGKAGLIDVPGEWFFDPADSMIYLAVEDGQDPNEMEIRGKIQSYAFDVTGSSGIKLIGLNFFGSMVSFVNCEHITLEDCHFLYPAYSKRMLGDLSFMDVTRFLVEDEFTPAHNTVRNCVFEYMDGPVMEMNGVGNLIENCYMHDVDYSCTYKGGYTLNLIDATELVFRRNTIHTTGASETFKAGRKNVIELNDISRTGFLQNDGSMIQISVKQQDSSITRFNWVHHSVKLGLRFDNSNLPDSPWGKNGTLHHNVAWKTDRIFFKGDKHFIFNNLSFDSEKNDLIVSSNVSIQGRNYETITRNNICNKFSGHRTLPGKDYPVPGIVDHNWAGNFKGKDIRTQLRDPDNLDYRPKAGSELIDAGALVEGKEFRYISAAPDIGPYEFSDDHYWIPGRMTDAASSPVPPDGATRVKTDADLMWLEGRQAVKHHVYFSTGMEEVKGRAETASMGAFSSSNIFTPPSHLEQGKTYYWCVDAMTADGTVLAGEVWSFTAGVGND